MRDVVLNTARMELALFIIFVGAAAGYLTSLGCRLMQSRGRKAGWYLALLGAAAGGVITVICIYQEEVFHPHSGTGARWHSVV
jgi:hypothetical protein